MCVCDDIDLGVNFKMSTRRQQRSTFYDLYSHFIPKIDRDGSREKFIMTYNEVLFFKDTKIAAITSRHAL